MIVRILSEGQYRLPSQYIDELDELDNKIVEVVAEGKREEFERLFGEMFELVRSKGQAVPVEELRESDLILPRPDSTMEEVQDLFTGAGLLELA